MKALQDLTALPTHFILDRTYIKTSLKWVISHEAN